MRLIGYEKCGEPNEADIARLLEISGDWLHASKTVVESASKCLWMWYRPIRSFDEIS